MVGVTKRGATKRGIKSRKEKLVKILSELQELSNLSAEELLIGGDNPTSQRLVRIDGKYQTALLRVIGCGIDTKEYEELYDELMERIGEKGKEYIQERCRTCEGAVLKTDKKEERRRREFPYEFPMVSLFEINFSP